MAADPEAPNAKGLTKPVAVSLYRDAAKQLGFVVEGPHQDQRMWHVSYVARSPEWPKVSGPSLNLLIYNNNISFISTIYGTKKDLPAAQRVAAVVEQALDQRGVRYEVFTRAAVPFLGP